MSDFELSERWQGLDDVSATTQDRRDAVLRELKLEIAPEHDLADLVVGVEAFFEASDDVIVRLVDSSYAIVHLSWIQRADRPPWPTAERIGRGAEASAAVRRWEAYR